MAVQRGNANEFMRGNRSSEKRIQLFIHLPCMEFYVMDHHNSLVDMVLRPVPRMKSLSIKAIHR